MKDYFKVTPAAYVILKKDDKILLIRRANTGYFDDSYSLPAGHFEGDESATEVAVREAKEEVGVTINSKDLKLVHTVHRQSDIPHKHERMDLFFETSKWQGEPINAEPEKCSGLLWTQISKLPRNIVPEVGLALERTARNETYGEVGF